MTPSENLTRQPSHPLRDKHQAPHPDTDIPSLLSTSQIPPLQVSADEVSKAIRSFPCTSTAGPDGLRPQHLKGMIGVAAGEGGEHPVAGLDKVRQLGAGGKNYPTHKAFLLWSHPASPGKVGRGSKTNSSGVHPTQIGGQVCLQQRKAGHGSSPGTPGFWCSLGGRSSSTRQPSVPAGHA